MFLSELRPYFDEAFSYPVDLETVVGQTGDVRIEAPNAADTQRIAAVLEPLGVYTFDSPDALFAAVYGNLDDAYIGRKYYDDRGDPGAADDSPRDEKNVSF